MEHTLADDINELNIRFDTAPRAYTKGDFQHLVHTIDHIAKYTASPQVKNDLFNGVKNAKRKYKRATWINFTTDGYPIADKCITQTCEFFVGERIYVPEASLNRYQNIVVHYYVEDEYGTVTSYKKTIELKNLVSGPGILLFRHVDHSDGVQPISDFYPCNSAFVYHKRRHYIDDHKINTVIEKKLNTTFTNSGWLDEDAFTQALIDGPWKPFVSEFNNSGESGWTFHNGIRLEVKYSKSRLYDFGEDNHYIHDMKYRRWGQRKKYPAVGLHYRGTGNVDSFIYHVRSLAFNEFGDFRKNKFPISNGASPPEYSVKVMVHVILYVPDYKRGIRYKYKFKIGISRNKFIKNNKILFKLFN